MERDNKPVPGPEDSLPTLKVVKGKNVGQRFPVSADRVVIGRRRCDITLPDPEASGAHAEIVRTSSGHLLRDLGSTNGTFLNGQPVRESALKPGDEIGIGRTLLAWQAAGAVSVEEVSTVDGPVRESISLGLFDAMPEFAALSAVVEDQLVGFRDEDGTRLMDLQGGDVNLKLPPQSVIQLELVGGPEKGRVVTLASGNVVIGRYGTDVVLKDSDVSRRHMTIEAYGRDQIFMRDLGSTNGCYVNGVKASFSKLQSGDTVVVGRTVMQLVVKDA